MSEIINGTNNRRNYPHPHDNGLMRYLERGCENDDSNDGELDDASRGHISRIPKPENFDSLTADKGDYTAGESTTEDEDESLSAEEVKELESLRDLDKIYQFLPPGLKGGGGSFSSVDHYSNEMSQSQPHHNYQRMDQYRPPPQRKNYRSASIVADESAVSTNSNNGNGRRNTIIFHHNHQDDPQQSNPTAPPKIAAKKMARGKTPDRELLALKRRLSVIIPANIITQSQHQPSTTIRVTAGGGGKDVPEIPTIRIVSPNPSSPPGSGSPSSPPSGGGDIPSPALFSSLVSIPEAGETAALPPSEILYLAKQSRGKATASYSPVLLFPSSATTTPYKGSSTADSQSSSCCHHKNSCPESGGYSNIAHQYLPYLPSPNFSPGGGGNLTGGSLKKFNFQRTPSLEKLLSIT